MSAARWPEISMSVICSHEVSMSVTCSREVSVSDMLTWSVSDMLTWSIYVSDILTCSIYVSGMLTWSVSVMLTWRIYVSDMLTWRIYVSDILTWRIYVSDRLTWSELYVEAALWWMERSCDSQPGPVKLRSISPKMNLLIVSSVRSSSKKLWAQLEAALKSLFVEDRKEKWKICHYIETMYLTAN